MLHPMGDVLRRIIRYLKIGTVVLQGSTPQDGFDKF